MPDTQYMFFLRGMKAIPYRRMKPTLKHRVALRPGMLGTVYALNEEGVERYFDYKWEDAIRYAGVGSDRDVRLHRNAWYITRKEA